MIQYEIQPGGSLHGKILVPGDKSISHRALMLAAIADGTTQIDGCLLGEDILATLNALRQMGISIDQSGSTLTVTGAGKYGLSAPVSPLDLGNSGTSARLFAGLLAGQSFGSNIIGDDSLMRRPMRRVIEPLTMMQADISCSDSGTLPVVINGGKKLKAIDYHMPFGSAQLKSCLLLAGLYADGVTVIHEPVVTRDHTERMLRYFGCEVLQQENTVSLVGGQSLVANNVIIPADISSAAFFMVGATIASGSDVLLQNVGINPARDAVIHILRAMGADITLTNQQTISGEPVANLRIRSAPLTGVTISPEQVSLAIDEFPAIMIAAACAEGKTLLRGAAELRVKESDRIESIAAGLTAIGILVRTFSDGLEVTGGQITGGMVESFSDHRIAMAFAMAGLRASDSIMINDCANVNTSFPGFLELSQAVGLMISQSGAA